MQQVRGNRPYRPCILWSWAGWGWGRKEALGLACVPRDTTTFLTTQPFCELPAK